MLWMSLALAGAPTKIVASLEDAGGTAVTDFTADVDNDLVAYLEEGSSQLRVLDGQTFEATAVSVCATAADVASWVDEEGVNFVVACEDGVDLVQVDGDRSVGSATSYELGVEGNISGLAVADSLWVITGAAGYPVDLESFELTDEAGSTLSREGVDDVIYVGNRVLILHGQDDISRIDTATGAVSQSQENLGGRDITRAVLEPGNTNILVADENGSVLRYQPSGDDYQILIDDLVGVMAIEVGFDESWVALAEDGGVQLHDYAGGVTVEPFELFDLDATELAALDGYLFVGTSTGEVHVLTDRPWIEFTSAPTETLLSGDDAQLSFTSDTAGDWTLSLGDDELASGSLEADAPATATVEIDALFAEGTNRLQLTLGEGRDAVDVVVDNPPPQPGVSVSWGDGVVYVDIDDAAIEDLGSYEIYVSTEEFTADDYPTGGPAGTAPVSPISLTSEGSVSHTISDVENGVTYHVAVRVIDQGGTEGAMSNVYEVTPRSTGGWAELAGAEGGCAHAPAGALFLLALIGLFAAPRAEAADLEGWKAKTKTNEVHFGPMSFEQQAFNAVYDDTYMLRFDGGRQLWRFFELNGSLGLVRKQGSLAATDSGDASGDSSQLTILPLSAGVTARLDPTARLKGEWRSMPVVPYGTVGVDYYLRRERYGAINVEDPFGNEVWSGGQAGWHYAVGVDVLLDWMDPKHASKAQARWGIEDTYLTLEWRTRSDWPDSTSSLSFAGDTVTLGLKVDRK